MADAVQDTRQEFWRSPILEAAVPAALPAIPQPTSAACADCGTEFMIGARFCHACGLRRPVIAPPADHKIQSHGWDRAVARVGDVLVSVADAWRAIEFPDWMQYLHFHEIQRWVGLPTAPLIAFIIGLGCVTGAVSVSLFYKASNLAEFQAIQMWRIEWLLAATASFVAGILLKKPSGD